MFKEQGFSKSVVFLAILFVIAVCGVGPLKKTCLELYDGFVEKGEQLAIERKKFGNYARAKLDPDEIKKLFTPRKDVIINRDELKKEDRIDLDKLIEQ